MIIDIVGICIFLILQYCLLWETCKITTHYYLEFYYAIYILLYTTCIYIRDEISGT